MGIVTAPQEFGSYMVYEQLGVGGMATVHVAESRGLRKRVALKRLLPHAAESPELVRSFINEARLVANLKHANIAQTSTYLNATQVGLQDAMRRLDASRCKPVASEEETDRAPLRNDSTTGAAQRLIN